MNHHRGLSFIEVMYSIIILTGVMVLISQFFSQSTKQLDRSKRYYLVSQLMEQKLTELELSYQKDGPSALIETEREDFENYPNFLWSLETKKMENMGPRDLIEGLREENQITNIMDQVAEQIMELVTEVRLTIYYIKMEPETSYSVTTYFVDFQKGNQTSFLQGLIPSLPTTPASTESP